MIALVFSPMHHTKSIGLADLLSMTYPKIFAQQPEETSHCYTLFLDGSRSSPAVRLASSAPRGDGAAMCGSERPLRRGRAADLCEGHGGRGQQRRPWPWKGRFGSVSFLQPDTLSAARETQQGNESTINQRKQEMI